MNCPYCDTPLDEHEANRCLDAWFHVVVMGLKVWDNCLAPYPNTSRMFDPRRMTEHKTDNTKCIGNPIDYYSTDIAAAWAGVLWMRTLEFAAQCSWSEHLTDSITARVDEAPTGCRINILGLLAHLEPVDIIRASIKLALRPGCANITRRPATRKEAADGD